MLVITVIIQHQKQSFFAFAALLSNISSNCFKCVTCINLGNI